jgi:hypothetical protein
MKTNPLDELTQNLTYDEKVEMAQAIQYLTEAAERGGTVESGGASAVINRLSPAVQQAFKLWSEVVETPRTMPFTPKMSEADYADSFGLDAEKSQLIKSALDGNEVTQRVIDRLGGADRPSQSPPSLRELLAASVDKHSQGA